MADSLRDQLLKSGLVQKLKVEVRPASVPLKPQSRHVPNKPHHARPDKAKRAHHGADQQRQSSMLAPTRSSEELDLARAYALRARDEKQERERTERAVAELARQKKERKQKLAQLVSGNSLNDASAEQARHFTHGNKIRRIYCTPEQLIKLNRGELGVVQNTGRYLLVDRDTALAAQAIDTDALVLLPDPNAAPDDDIPADLIW
jgi:uncharacterized protein YaiL (DUF2058 family)